MAALGDQLRGVSAELAGDLTTRVGSDDVIEMAELWAFAGSNQDPVSKFDSFWPSDVDEIEYFPAW